jgi:glutathione peroxidase
MLKFTSENQALLNYKLEKVLRYLLMSLICSLGIHAKNFVESGSAYDYSFKTLIGEEPLPLKQFAGKVILIVNTASHCGFTQQYEGLQKLYEKYKDRGLVILGVPSNDFGGQEPGSNKDIASFCKLNYGVSFPMAAKEAVSGIQAHPFYQWAKSKLGFGTAPKWNFHKYLIDQNGHLVDYFNSTTSPTSSKIENMIEKLLKEKGSEDF